MKTMKYFTVLVLLFCLFQPVFPEKRVKPLPMKEFTDPSSPSFVPHPYPKNRKEIIADLKYAINKIYGDKWPTEGGEEPEIRVLLNNIFVKNSEYEIGEIIKVKNRLPRVADDYTWLILVRDKTGTIAARISIPATGLFGGARLTTEKAANYYRDKYPGSKIGPHFLKTDEDAINRLSDSIGRVVDKNEIKKIERLGVSSRFGFLYIPMFEIKMAGGKIYYYSPKNDTVYEIEKKLKWEKNSKGKLKAVWTLVPSGSDFFMDSISEEIILIKKVDKKSSD